MLLLRLFESTALLLGANIYVQGYFVYTENYSKFQFL